MSDSPTPKHPREAEADSAPSLARTLRAWLRGVGVGRDGDTTLREDLRELLEQHEDAGQRVNAEERMILTNLVKLGELRVGDEMIPRTDVVGIEIDSSLADIVAVFREALHSRLPVYRDTLDSVLGMTHIKDLLPYWVGSADFDLRQIVRDVLFVPPSMPVLDLLLRMRTARIHMAMVVDEFGGTDGLVTIEDMVEAVVGEIEDEHDEVEGPLIIEIRPGVLEADARAPREEVENLIGCDFLPEDRDEDIDTLGGVVVSLAGRVPQRGEIIAHPSGVAFEVIDADARRIRRVRVRKITISAEKPPPKADG